MIHRRDLLKIGAATAVGFHFGAGIVGAAQEPNGGFFIAGLTGGQEVPPVETSAQGGALFSVAEDGSSLEYAVVVNALENVTQGHIHLGGADENGPVVVWLYPGPDEQEPRLMEGRTDAVLASGSIAAEHLVGELEGESLDALVAEMAAGNAYVNLHTEANPAGEIRGQLTTLDALGLGGTPAATETAEETETVEATETETAEAVEETPESEATETEGATTEEGSY